MPETSGLTRWQESKRTSRSRGVARRAVAALASGESLVFADDTSTSAGSVDISYPVQLEKTLGRLNRDGVHQEALMYRRTNLESGSAIAHISSVMPSDTGFAVHR